MNTQQALHIADNDMIHIVWKHVTIRLNVTGLIYLVDFLEGKRRHHGRVIGFDITANPDDGYQVWVEDIGLRLSSAEFEQFKALLCEGLEQLRRVGKAEALRLPHCLKLTAALPTPAYFSEN